MIRQLKPDAIVCTHPFPNVVISRLKRFGLTVPLCTVITDYDAHGTWVSKEVSTYLVSTPDVKRKLLIRGIPSERIQVTGIPIHPNFWERHNREELRSHFGLKRLPTVLVMGGGWGLVKNEDFLTDLIRWRDRIQLVVCLGSNEKALAELKKRRTVPASPYPAFGFYERNRQMDGGFRSADHQARRYDLYRRAGQGNSDAVL